MKNFEPWNLCEAVELTLSYGSSSVVRLLCVALVFLLLMNQTKTLTIPYKSGPLMLGTLSLVTSEPWKTETRANLELWNLGTRKTNFTILETCNCVTLESCETLEPCR